MGHPSRTTHYPSRSGHVGHVSFRQTRPGASRSALSCVLLWAVVDRYGNDVLKSDPNARRVAPLVEVPAKTGLVIECPESGFCGAIVHVDGSNVLLEDRHGRRRIFPMRRGSFLLDGKRVTLVKAAVEAGPKRSASGSRYVENLTAKVAAPNRIWVEGIHDAELVEKVWGHDLRVEGVVVEPLHGADDLMESLREFRPDPRRRVGVLLDHLVAGSKETRLANQARRAFRDILVLGHPYVDVWQAVKPSLLGIAEWPVVPPGTPWKQGVIDALGWRVNEAQAWAKILGRVRGYGDLEPSLLGRVEQLIDFVTAP